MVLTLGRGSRMAWLALLMVLALVAAGASPAVAHTDHKKKLPEVAQVALTAQSGAPTTLSKDPAVVHAPMSETMDQLANDRSTMSTGARLIDWLGRFHPMIVHFPMAFFPAALFTAVVGRRRPAFANLARFMVVAGGILAPIAALLGWFNAGLAFATDDALLAPHRWLGTAIGVGAPALAIWAWREPEADRGMGMIIGLSVITAAIIVQGWFGGALVHGMDHLNW